MAYKDGRRIRIEFEYRSRNFKLHRHEPRGCDWIVCWIHNWPEAPSSLRVVELRREFGLGFNVWFQPVAGDYTVEGMEKLLGLERKSLADLVACTVTYRRRFLAACGRLARLPWKAILVEATLEDIKGGFAPFDIPSQVHPNAVCGTLDAIEAKFGIPIIYASTARELATERAASWLSKHFTYWWLERHGHGRVLIDSDRL